MAKKPKMVGPMEESAEQNDRGFPFIGRKGRRGGGRKRSRRGRGASRY